MLGSLQRRQVVQISTGINTLEFMQRLAAQAGGFGFPR